jgi:hypothetical protein
MVSCLAGGSTNCSALRSAWKEVFAGKEGIQKGRCLLDLRHWAWGEQLMNRVKTIAHCLRWNRRRGSGWYNREPSVKAIPAPISR